ncbi:SURF1 family protein [Gammaproteobacteria bacterium]|nr:SURF1 family protein [Gammaproteobacteria bacterium]
MNRTFRFNWKVTVFSILCLSSFLHLGFWQLDREVEKRELLSQTANRLTLVPLNAGKLPEQGDLEGVPVRLLGEYQEQVLLLDNKVLDGKVGFEAHQLFRDNTGLLFLVNRGFVPMGRTREDQLKFPKVHDKPADILGRIYQPGSQILLLADQNQTLSKFPVIVQHIDVKKMIDTFSERVYPFVIRLELKQLGSLPRYWPSTVMSPEKHKGYAIQWFSMALAVLIAWLFFSFSKDLLND